MHRIQNTATTIPITSAATTGLTFTPTIALRYYRKLNLRLSLFGSSGHPQQIMRDLGISYQVATPQSIGDQWWFWNCTNVPDPLPEFLSVLDLHPYDGVGWGLSQEQANSLVGTDDG